MDYVSDDNEQNETIIKIISDKEILYIPATVQNISSSVLLDNKNVKYLYFENGSQLNNLEECVFCNSSLVSASFQNCENLTKLPKWCFINSSQLTSCILPNSLKVISYGCFANTALYSIVFPDSLELIESSMNSMHAPFHYCIKLVSVSFSVNSNLRELPQRIFWDCKSLKQIILPPSIVNVSEGVFGGCSSLESIYFLSDKCQFTEGAFSNYNCKNIFVLNENVQQNIENVISDDQPNLKINLLTKPHTTSSCSYYLIHPLLFVVFL